MIEDRPGSETGARRRGSHLATMWIPETEIVGRATVGLPAELM